MDTIADRLTTLMRERGYKQADLVRITGVSSGGASQWLSGRTRPTGRNLQLLADEFEVEPTWLDSDKGNSVREARLEYHSRRGTLPLYSYAELADKLKTEKVWRSIGVDTEGAFSIVVEGEAMQGTGGIPNGAVAICAPQGNPIPGNLVLVNTHGKILLRRLSAEGKTQYLTPQNPAYPVLPFDTEVRVLGIIIGYSVRFQTV